jgi:hypothetical protein
VGGVWRCKARAVEQRGFATADFAGKQDQSFASKNSAGQLTQRFVRMAGAIEITRVGDEAERIFLKTEESLVCARAAQ